VTEYKIIFKETGTFIYFIALMGGLYTGMFKVGYLITILVMVM
jgi:hypothetical protein